MTLISKFYNKISNWWNKIDFIEIEMRNTNYVLRIPRKYVSIGYETDSVKTITLKDIKKAGHFIQNIYPRLVLTHPESWKLYVPKAVSYNELGWFEDPMFEIGSGLNSGFFMRILNHEDIQYIGCFGKWYRTVFGFFRLKPYIEIYRSNYILNVPWNTKNIKSFGDVNKEQAISYRKEDSGYVTEIRWTNKAIEIFEENKENYITYKDLMIKSNKRITKKTTDKKIKSKKSKKSK